MKKVSRSLNDDMNDIKRYAAELKEELERFLESGDPRVSMSSNCKNAIKFSMIKGYMAEAELFVMTDNFEDAINNIDYLRDVMQIFK